MRILYFDLRRVLATMFVMLVILSPSLGLNGCALNPLAEAETLEQRVYATYGTFVIIEENIADLVSEGSGVRPANQVRLIRGVEAAQPAIDSMLEAYDAYEEARAEFEAGSGTPESVILTVTANLADWVEEAEDIVENLRRSYNEVRR